jgi:hypothetical protein
VRRVIDHRHTFSRDGAGLQRLRNSKNALLIRLETLRQQELALAAARERIEATRNEIARVTRQLDGE